MWAETRDDGCGYNARIEVKPLERKAPLNAARFMFLLALIVSPTTRAAIDLHTPTDTQVYIAIDVRQAFDSEFFRDNLLDPARDLLAQLPGVNETLKELRLDPFKDVDRLVLASPGTQGNDRGLVVAYGRFDVDKFKTRVERLKKDNDDSVTLHEVPLGGGVKHAVYEVAIPGMESGAFVALKDGKTLLVSPGKDYVVDALKAARLKTKPTLKNKEMQTLIESLEAAKQVLTVALPGSALTAVDDLVPGGGAALKGIAAIGGGATFGKELRFDLAITCHSEENAMEIRSKLDKGVKLATAALALLGEEKKELSLLFELVKSIRTIGKGKAVGVSARVTAETLQDLFGKGG